MIEPVKVNLIGLARDLNLPPESVEAVVNLLNDENPIPFIARFRKDLTGNMNEEQIRLIAARYADQKSFVERKAAMLRILESKGLLTPDLEKKIRSARNSRRLADVYSPYKQPKQSLAAAAREKGLQPLADAILSGDAADLQAAAAPYVNAEKEIAAADDALKFAGYIISEQFSLLPELRQTAREIFERTGKITSQKAEEKKPAEAQDVPPAETPKAESPAAEAKAEQAAPAESPAAETKTESPAAEAAAPTAAPAAAPVRAKSAQAKKRRKERKKESAAEQRRQRDERLYSDYFDFSGDLRSCPGYRILALNRGLNERRLKVRLVADTDEIKKEAKAALIPAGHANAAFLEACLDDALARLLIPQIEREVRREAVENAKKQALGVYAKNTRNLLLQKPLFRRRVLAVAPGFRFGCKLAALDEFGNFLGDETVFITGSAERKKRTVAKIAELIERYKITVIAIGNGTGCREAESLIAAMISEKFPDADIAYTIVNEAGASAYSNGPLSAQELPHQSALTRSAISIGRRLQDPLNELVKIDPANMGVGIYQHDMKPKDLKDTLTEVVASAVNFVGVDLNTATSAILRYVSGLNQLTAKRIADYRRQNGPFRSRRELMNVPGFGTASFTHAAGFLKIRDGVEPLDATWIHPESYELAEKILDKIGFSKDDLRNSVKHAELTAKLDRLDPKTAAEELGAGLSTVADIFEQLKRPGRDPREGLPAPIFKKGVMKIENLEPGMELMGTVLNVVDFGAFVDIGLHNPGLVHISRMGERYVRDAHQRLSVGDIVKVWVVDTDIQRERISLSMLAPGQARRAPDRG
ncbi:MAG: helix-hairpin-helix domain-containing protein, partial [Thermoguttaceae bacterium]|nr:helix-hairpin-helix domain-containing protein [Thermoguttaceae bacterium]